MSQKTMSLCVFAWPKGGHVEKCRVFVCCCSVELGEIAKSVVFLCVFWVKSKSVVFLYVLGFLCVFARSKGGNVEKCRVCRKCRVFVCFLGEVGHWALDWSAQPII